jgi:hypothetical protein
MATVVPLANDEYICINVHHSPRHSWPGQNSEQAFTTIFALPSSSSASWAGNSVEKVWQPHKIIWLVVQLWFKLGMLCPKEDRQGWHIIEMTSIIA